MPGASAGNVIADSAQIQPGVIVNSDINASAAIAQSKLSLDITNSEINASAGIVDTKLAQITTAGKVSGAALTSLASIPAGAGAIPSANLSFVPAWSDEGSQSWSASSSDQTITFVNSGKDLYRVLLVFTSCPSGLALRLNGATGATYNSTEHATGAFGTRTGQTSMRITDSSDVMVMELLIQGKHASGVKTVAVIGSNYGPNILVCGNHTADSNNLSNITIMVNGGSATGKVHVYGLNL